MSGYRRARAFRARVRRSLLQKRVGRPSPRRWRALEPSIPAPPGWYRHPGRERGCRLEREGRRGGSRRRRSRHPHVHNAPDRRLQSNCRVRCGGEVVFSGTDHAGTPTHSGTSPRVASHESLLRRTQMADVQVNAPGGGTPVESGGGSSAAWAIVVIVLGAAAHAAVLAAPARSRAPARHDRKFRPAPAPDRPDAGAPAQPRRLGPRRPRSAAAAPAPAAPDDGGGLPCLC